MVKITPEYPMYLSDSVDGLDKLAGIEDDEVAENGEKAFEKLFGRQVLKHENLGDYFNSKVPSLKEFHGQKTNGGVKTSFTKLLTNVMQLIQRHEFTYIHEEWINMVKPVLDSADSVRQNSAAQNKQIPSKLTPKLNDAKAPLDVVAFIAISLGLMYVGSCNEEVARAIIFD